MRAKPVEIVAEKPLPTVEPAERALTVVLRLAGTVLMLAFGAALLPARWRTIAFGLAMFVIDVRAGMPPYWTLGEGPPIVGIGTVFLLLSRRVRRDDAR